MNNSLRCEHPKPQMERKDWLNLNGLWQFERDDGRSGVARELYKKNVYLKNTINVPFCPESKLSGIEDKDFYFGMCYKRAFSIPQTWKQGKVFLHFGAVDYSCVVYVNETRVGQHKGGYVSFSMDISDALQEENEVTVFVQDDTRDPLIPRGKQSEEYASHGCDYTRTSGIWQTVWLEHTPDCYIQSVKYYTDIETPSLTVIASLMGAAQFSLSAAFKGKPVGCCSVQSDGGSVTITLPLSEKHLWQVGNGQLYDLKLVYGEDTVRSYFGLRSISMAGGRFLLNGKSVFQRLVLDQGFYPDGIYTAPSDEALIKDIQLSMNCGFNGARLHQKVFEERFLYHCDRMGYIVWGEYPDWGLDHTNPQSIYSILPEWTEVLHRDFNHPAIIGWCPHNETWDKYGNRQFDESIRMVYRMTKEIDPTRPCIDTSGNFHVETDIFDLHDYEQNPAEFKAHYDEWINDSTLKLYTFMDRQTHRGEPVFISEYGGIGWSTDDHGWGYGNAPKSLAEFYERFRGLTEAILTNPKLFGFCYTQLTNVEQEQNGLYTYEREPKFDVSIIREIVSQKAAIEE